MKRIPTLSSSKHEEEGIPQETRTKIRSIKQIMIIGVKEERDYDFQKEKVGQERECEYMICYSINFLIFIDKDNLDILSFLNFYFIKKVKYNFKKYQGKVKHNEIIRGFL